MKENLIFLINVVILNFQDFQDFQTRSEIKAKLNIILKNKKKKQKPMKKPLAKSTGVPTHIGSYLSWLIKMRK